MGYSLSQAAKATGKDKSTISKAIKKGRISANRKDNGPYDIDPAELHRWYPPVNTSQDIQPVASSTPVNTDSVASIKELEAKLVGSEQEARLLRGQIDGLEADKEFLQQQLTRTTALLTDQRGRGDAQEPSGGRLSRVWSILRGKD